MQDPKDPDPNKPGEEARPQTPRPRTRRPYEPPRIVHRDKLEGRANVCDPLTGKTAPPTCGVNRS